MHPTTINQLLGVNHVLGLRAKEEVSTRSSPIKDWSKGLTVDWYFEIVQGSGKILYSSNRLILD